MKRAVIAGGSGFIGSYLCKRFSEDGWKVDMLGRRHADATWDNYESILKVLNGSDVLINLAGRSINCIHNERNRQTILNSRLETTSLLGKTIQNCTQPPAIWFNASSVALSQFERPGEDFLADVARDWERTFFSFSNKEVRKVALRFAVVLGKNEGFLRSVIPVVKLGLGGQQGNGKQIFSWVHVEDLYSIIRFITDRDHLAGSFDCAAPGNVTNRELMKTLRNLVHMPVGLPAPSFAVKLGARLMGTEPSLILQSNPACPKRLVEEGFEFRFSRLSEAVTDLYAR